MFNVLSLKNGLENVAGFSFGGVSMGLKKDGSNDLGFIKAHKNHKFKETLGEYKYNQYNSTEDKGTESTSSLLKNRKKRVIIYQLQ